MHRPALGGDDGARGKCVAHKVKNFVDGAILGRRRRDDAFEGTWCGAV